MNTVAKYTPSHFLQREIKKQNQKRRLYFIKISLQIKNLKKFFYRNQSLQMLLKNPLLLHIQLKTFLITDYNLIQKMNDTRIFLCIYQIKNNNHKAQISYIEYLLYKYPSSIKSKKLADTFTFPYTVSKRNETSLVTANKLFYDITNGIYGKEEPLGFLEKENDLYFFYKTVEQGPIVEYYKSTQELWWVTYG